MGEIIDLSKHRPPEKEIPKPPTGKEAEVLPLEDYLKHIREIVDGSKYGDSIRDAENYAEAIVMLREMIHRAQNSTDVEEAMLNIIEAKSDMEEALADLEKRLPGLREQLDQLDRYTEKWNVRERARQAAAE
ncbi:hypothetical protein A3B21_05430 [Candidatus Uhrbacteria bacterium RIFCSPLOWO2_01_FULL_47_24]|uniref:Uncharacterized protein n=1 Tax=Candidatus Uhrbacteria bacterium RIFCSPLOWO2_01_FULL_47_24 TaxID=1802401 RepID=A0A1F7UV25_9BACT|nr:MAG: hypothetical protein A2753_01250 [Candidatus Uhrbacteria bacterium RIFCSPHIGHO2_01_FULL_47_11]OGL67505.1 MAG: hypothetical protein A3D58_01625 [Candidatus Uhrbacteria bacterium RIFCSPHIGHO2_02_FULL_46_47]OGL76525.1 MAG: hypothetical protein A3F52_02785 [Candidatus Uhrbacteria bacterium RIFCSPHIGHO2_12_FULL_47_11]OGL82119.1 MAG: hypothetical protein A3B21_05430 [Candidatus Uhrbacteria bacterium RIFCSPLOWO2_01_FULL_47_24]OGL83866.1 MAG: hypothetical protein A3J03_01910 [Candidatus Uhrbact